MLDKKLQLKEGQTIAILYGPKNVAVEASQVTVDQADAVLVFATNKSELEERVTELRTAASRTAVTWLAYPKAKQLGTDINRDLIREFVAQNDLDTVRQIAIDDTWSALRLKTLSD